jgi:exoribonuclease R
VLEHAVGEVFDAVVVETDDRGGVVQLRDPAVTARCTGDDLPLGERIRARLAVADVAQRLVRFERAG